MIGAIFDRVWYEGDPRNEWYGMQTVLLGASNSATIDFIVPEEGVYKLVDHEFADAERGAAGALIAGPRKDQEVVMMKWLGIVDYVPWRSQHL